MTNELEQKSFILGTANLGSSYGVANKNSTIQESGVEKILRTAQSLEILEFDTAPKYGSSEIKLGKYLDQSKPIKISTKLDETTFGSEKLMFESVHNSLERTKVKKLDTLYLHNSDWLEGNKVTEIVKGLKEILAAGLTSRIGVSVYDVESILRVRKVCPEISVFQVPENICDRRLLSSKSMFDMKDDGILFNVRSIFLQGLLLMPLERIPLNLQLAGESISQLQNLANQERYSVFDLCLSYAKRIPWARGIVIGTASASQLSELANSRDYLPLDWESKLTRLPEWILDPRKWL